MERSCGSGNRKPCRCVSEYVPLWRICERDFRGMAEGVFGPDSRKSKTENQAEIGRQNSKEFLPSDKAVKRKDGVPNRAGDSRAICRSTLA